MIHMNDKINMQDARLHADFTSLEGWTNTTVQTQTKSFLFTTDIIEVPPRPNLFSSVVWECYSAGKK